MKLDKDACGETGRIDVPTMFPEFIIVDEDDNPRAPAERHTQEEIIALAQRIVKEGQDTPALGRKIAGGKVKLVAGYGRHKAFTYINNVLQPDKPLKMQIRIQDMNAEEAFAKAIRENLDRKETRAVSDAHAQRILREHFNWPEEKIAEFYEKSVSYIGQLRKIVSLSTPIQEQIKNGSLPVSTAVTLTEIPEEDRPQALHEATNPETGKVDGEVIKTKVRQHKARTGATNGIPGRSMKQVREFLEGCQGPGETEAVRMLTKKIQEFIAGKITDIQLMNAFNKWTVSD
jgi:ParB/RepB/Spo0J family partition protein